MNWIIYNTAAALLRGAELFYLRLAVLFKIISAPNHRSSHSRLTVRGGGIIFWLAAFFAGLTLFSLVSGWGRKKCRPQPLMLFDSIGKL